MHTTTNQPQFHTRAGAAEYLTAQGYPIATSYLAKLAHMGGGPTYQIFGNRALYRAGDLLEWAQSRLSGPISNTAQRAEVAQ